MTETLSMTPSQVKATLPQSSVWVGASAGTGKTHVLTARVLRLMVSGTLPEKILCLTFTKAAAAEMSNRIYKDLGKWVTKSDEDLKKTLLARTGEIADQEMLDRARSLFGRVLDTPGGLKIQTIHSFCQSLLGRFPIEAGLTPRFKVMEDRTASELMKSSRETSFTNAKEGGDGETLKAIEHIATRVAEPTFAELMAHITSERGHFRELLRRFNGVKGLSEKIYQALEIENFETIESYLEKVLTDDQMDIAGLRVLAEALLAGSKTEKTKGQKLADFLEANPADRGSGFHTYKSVFLTKNGAPLKAVANKDTLKNEALLDIITLEQNRVLEIVEKLGLIEVAQNTCAMIQLASTILLTYDKEKDRGGYLDYADLILKSDQLLSRVGLAAWVLYKLDGGVDHILVDESQDTNPEQWRLIEALTEEFFVGSGARDITRTLFAVGDAKQSIFSFQRADPAEFNRARERAHTMTRESDLGFENISLNLSFRSTPAILNCVDAVFAQEDANKNLTLAQESVTHNTNREGEAGRVELWPFEPHEILEDEGGWSPPLSQLKTQSAATRLAQRIANKIEGFLSSEEELTSKGRAIKPGDIMVLVRRRNEFVESLIRELKVRHIPVAGADRMTLLDQLAVMDLMALGEFALLPEDDLNLATVLKSPFIGLDDDALFKLAWGRDKNTSLWDTLQKKKGDNSEFEKAYLYLREILARADFIPPYEFYEEILVKQGGRQSLLKRLGPDAGDPIDVFLSLALGFESDHTPSLQGFLGWVKASEENIKRDMEASGNQVRIMTIHGAKGLQAPIVFLPDTCQLPRASSALLKVANVGGLSRTREPDLLVWSGGSENETGLIKNAREALKARADEEYRRLLYVALTRAEDRLYVGGWVTSQGKAERSWYDLIEAGMSDLEGVKEEKGALIYQTPQTKMVEQVGTDQEQKEILVEIGPWAYKNPPEETMPPKPIAPSRIDQDIPGESPLIPREKTGPMERGTLIHRLLEILPGISIEDREAYTLKALKDFEDKDRIWEQISAILENPEFGMLFGPGSRAEVPIAGVVGKTPFTAYIDRLVVRDKDVLIVDYKTNRTPPENSQKIPKAYLKQMGLYKAALEEIFKGKKVRALLLWTEGLSLLEIPDIELEKYKPQ